MNVKLWVIPFEKKKSTTSTKKEGERKNAGALVSECSIRDVRALDAKIRRREWEKPIKIKIFMYSRGGS